MFILTGKPTCKGIVFGKIKYYSRAKSTVLQNHIKDTEIELQRFRDANNIAIKQLANLYVSSLSKVGEKEAMIFEVHQMMLKDEDYCGMIEEIILSQQVNTEYAVLEASDKFAKMFLDMDNQDMKERASDVRDISNRLIAVLQGRACEEILLKEPVILLADDFAPSETIQMDKTKILAFVTSGGSVNSHAAILSRTMGIPSIVGVGADLNETCDGQEAIVNGGTGEIIINPNAKTILQMTKEQSNQKMEQKLLENLKGKESVTLNGQTIKLCANISNLSDMPSVLENDAEGIGLFRSEFIYMGRKNYPTEEEQFQIYKSVAQQMNGKSVVIRTMDIGADKNIDYFNLPKEENPSLGMRAIRISLTRPEIFKTQLRALYRASKYGKIAIMFPMIASVSEVKRIKEIVRQVKDELTSEKIPFTENLQLGIMIETPAAAIISDQLAKEVDFFSIGTNDLTQYTLAIDRQNLLLEEFCDIHHEAILRLIQIVTENAHKEKIKVGICGELGMDLSLTEIFLQMGIDELSVAPSCILALRQKIRETIAT